MQIRLLHSSVSWLRIELQNHTEWETKLGSIRSTIAREVHLQNIAFSTGSAELSGSCQQKLFSILEKNYLLD